MFDYQLEHVFSYDATLSAPEIIGPVPDDIRVNFYVTGGKCWLPDKTVIGEVLPVGGDWLTIRRDNTGVLDVRATVKTSDGALLYVVYNGLLDLGPDGHANLLKGKWPAKGKIRAAPRITTSHANYAWANATQFLNVGEVDFAKRVVQYDVYAVR